MYYTYLHTRNDNGKVFYIGKGTHKRAYTTDRNEHWCSIVAKHGFTAEILAHWSTEQEAYDHEKLLIASFTEMGYVLANKTPGGEGIPKGFKHSEQARRNMGQSRLGFKHTEETKKKMSASSSWRGHIYTTSGFTGFNHTEESRNKMSVARKGRKQSAEHVAKRFASLLSNPNYKPPGLGKKYKLVVKCNHCNGTYTQASYNHWHGDNCKMKNSTDFVMCNDCGVKLTNKSSKLRWHRKNACIKDIK
jgi:hypothetical protein